MQAHAISSADSRRSAGEQAILEAAVQLFSNQGFDGVSMRQVAEQAGVSKANIYHHFNSKEALYLAIMHNSAQRLSGLVDQLEEGEGPFEDRLRQFAQSHLEHLFGNAATLRLFLREMISGDEDRCRIMVDQGVGEVFQRLIRIFREGQQAGVLKNDLDPGLCAMVLMGGDIFYFQSHHMLKHFPEAGSLTAPSNYSNEMMNVILSGMLADSVGGLS